MNPARRLSALAVGVVAVLGLGACTSQPSAKAVAKDVVQSIGLTADQEACMLAAIDTYSSEQIEAIGEANETVDFSQGDPATRGDEELQQFYADLNACMGDA